MRLNGAGHDMVAGVKLRVMQPAITEWSKWQPDARADVLAAPIAVVKATTATTTADVRIERSAGSRSRLMVEAQATQSRWSG